MDSTKAYTNLKLFSDLGIVTQDSKALSKAKVFSIYQVALKRMGQKTDSLVRWVYEFSVIWYEESKKAKATDYRHNFVNWIEKRKARL